MFRTIFSAFCTLVLFSPVAAQVVSDCQFADTPEVRADIIASYGKASGDYADGQVTLWMVEFPDRAETGPLRFVLLLPPETAEGRTCKEVFHSWTHGFNGVGWQEKGDFHDPGEGRMYFDIMVSATDRDSGEAVGYVLGLSIDLATGEVEATSQIDEG